MQDLPVTKFPPMLKINKENGWKKIKRLQTIAIVLIVYFVGIVILVFWLREAPLI